MGLGIEYVYKEFEDVIAEVEANLEDERYGKLNNKLYSSFRILEENLTMRELSKVEEAFSRVSNSYDVNISDINSRNIDAFYKDFQIYIGIVNKLIEELRDIDEYSKIGEEFD